MADKIQVHRRGFLAKLLKGAAATVVTTTVLEVADDGKVKAIEEKKKEVEPFTSDLFNRKNWPTMDELESKVADEIMSDLEVYQLAWYMQVSRNGNRIMCAYAKAQKNIKNLVRLHPLVAPTIVAVATGKSIWSMISEPQFKEEDLKRNLDPEFCDQSLSFTKPRK